jgi:CRP/FNR family transcriptional regulator, cyclic AMP receptor protein
MEIAKAQNLVSTKGWLSDTPPPFRQLVLDRALLLRVDAGATLHVVGDELGGMYGVVSGAIAVFLAGEDGLRLMHLLRPGTWVGEGPAITGVSRLATLSASRPTSLFHLRQRAIQEIVDKNPRGAWSRPCPR